METTRFNRIVKEISSFAEDENDVIVDRRKGSIIFERGGEILSLYLAEENDNLYVKFKGQPYSYRDFLGKILGRLDTFAKKLAAKSTPAMETYVDPDAELLSNEGKRAAKALSILKAECKNTAFTGTKISFVTADAGHGKTMLLKQFQKQQAVAYLEGDADFIFWHIDLHGRDLVRLNEAIMYELGLLRISGLYDNSIITLIRNGLIVLGIDGFDELAAEIGGEMALGSLTNLVNQLDGEGVIIAASRRTFFDTQDYVKRTRLLDNKIGEGCDFDELKIQNWKKEQCVQFMACYYSAKEIDGEYDRIKHMFEGNKNAQQNKQVEHPLLERPFLFTRVVQSAYDENKLPSEFITQGQIVDDNINNVIELFVKREVRKWKETDKATGKPYLTFEQHMELLSEIAKEMWDEQKNYISIETIQFLLTILFEEWGTDETLQPLIVRMVSSHALLTIAEQGDNYRCFDHEEFKNFFFARSVKNILVKALEDNNMSVVEQLLSKAQLPDSVALYLMNWLDGDQKLSIITGLLENENNQWKPTYFQPNLGTLLPFMLDKTPRQNKILISNKITFSSLVFENKEIADIEFTDCSFINISFNNTKLTNVQYRNCKFTDIRMYQNSGNHFDNVIIANDCDVAKATIMDSQDDTSYSEYSPCNIDHLLSRAGIMREQPADMANNVIYYANPKFRKIIKRFLNRYNKSSIQYEVNIKEEKINNSSIYDELMSDVIPMLLEYGIIEEVTNKNTRQVGSKAWKLKYELPEVYAAEEDSNSPLHQFWEIAQGHK